MGLAAERLLDRYLPDSYRKSDPKGFQKQKSLITELPAEGYAYITEAINRMNFDSRKQIIDVASLVIAGGDDVATPAKRMEIYRD